MDLMVICQGCLSQDRSLRPLGEFENLFMSLFRHSFDVFQISVKTSDLSLCWECLQIIKNIHKFHNKVVEAQLTLNNHIKQQSNNPRLKTLSSLTVMKVPLNESVTAEQKLSILKIETQDSKGMFLNFPQMSGEKSKQGKSHKTPNDKTLSINTVKNIKKETEYYDNYYEQEDTFDITIEPYIEIKEEERHITLQKRKPKPAQQNKGEKKTCKSQQKSHDLGTAKEQATKYRLSKYRFSKDERFYRILNLLSIVPGSLGEDGLERLSSEKDSLKCTKCNEVCYNETDFTSHMKSHFQRYMCRLCGDDLTYDEDKIYIHIMSKHRELYAKIQCSQPHCEMKFISEEERDKHSSECGIFKCNHCIAVFKSEMGIAAHCRKHMTYKCIDCNKEYATLNRYRSHRSWKHSKTKLEAAYCIECDKQFNSALHLRQHFKTSVKHRSAPVVRKSFLCTACPKVCSSAELLKSHYDMIHVGITRFHCEPCNKYFFSKYLLKTHNRIQHEKIPLPKDKLCQHCGRGFNTKKSLKHHIYTHTGERPYQCTYCDAKFTQRSSRNAHMRIRHKHGITEDKAMESINSTAPQSHMSSSMKELSENKFQVVATAPQSHISSSMKAEPS